MHWKGRQQASCRGGGGDCGKRCKRCGRQVQSCTPRHDPHEIGNHKLTCSIAPRWVPYSWIAQSQCTGGRREGEKVQRRCNGTQLRPLLMGKQLAHTPPPSPPPGQPLISIQRLARQTKVAKRLATGIIGQTQQISVPPPPPASPSPSFLHSPPCSRGTSSNTTSRQAPLIPATDHKQAACARHHAAANEKPQEGGVWQENEHMHFPSGKVCHSVLCITGNCTGSFEV